MGLPEAEEKGKGIQVVTGGKDDEVEKLAVSLLAKVDHLVHQFREIVRETLREATNGELDEEFIVQMAESCSYLLKELPKCTGPLKKWVEELAKAQVSVHNRTKT